MYIYYKILLYPCKVDSKDLNLVNTLLKGLNVNTGELSSAVKYFNQASYMPTDKGKALLVDIATEELSHEEILNSILKQILSNNEYDRKTEDRVLDTSLIKSNKDYIALLNEDIEDERNAILYYESLMELTNDTKLLNIFFFLRQRENVHLHRFKELKDSYLNK